MYEKCQWNNPVVNSDGTQVRYVFFKTLYHFFIKFEDTQNSTGHHPQTTWSIGSALSKVRQIGQYSVVSSYYSHSVLMSFCQHRGLRKCRQQLPFSYLYEYSFAWKVFFHFKRLGFFVCFVLLDIQQHCPQILVSADRLSASERSKNQRQNKIQRQCYITR